MLILKLPSEHGSSHCKKITSAENGRETLLIDALGAFIAVGLYALACLIGHLKH